MVRAIYIAQNASLTSLIPPVVGASWIETPITQESVKPSSSSTESAIIRADRQPQDQIRTGFEVGGSMPSEMMFAAFDHLLPAALGSTGFAAVVADITGESITVTASSKNIAAAAGTPFSGYAVGDYFRIEDTNLGTNDDVVVRIAAINNSGADVTVDSETSPLADDSSTATTTLRFGERIAGGETKRQFSYAKHFSDSDGDDVYELILGLLISSWNLQLSPNSIVTTSFDFVGRKVVPEFDGDVTINADGDLDAGGTQVDLTTLLPAATPAPSNRVYNAISNATVILDKSVSTVMTNLQFTLNNNVTGEAVVGTQGNAFVELGNLTFGGTVEAIVEDTTLYQKFINDQQASIALYLVDSSNQGYVIDLPAVSINDGGTSIPGQTGSIKLPIQFGAGVDSVTNRAISITKLPAS